MNFSDFLINGSSAADRQYDHDFHLKNYNYTPLPSMRERIAGIWDEFSIYTKLMISGGLVGITVGAVVIVNAALPPAWIAGAVIGIAALAFAIFSIVRHIQAEEQAGIWRYDHLWELHESNVQSHLSLKNRINEYNEIIQNNGLPTF